MAPVEAGFSLEDIFGQSTLPVSSTHGLFFPAISEDTLAEYFSHQIETPTSLIDYSHALPFSVKENTVHVRFAREITWTGSNAVGLSMRIEAGRKIDDDMKSLFSSTASYSTKPNSGLVLSKRLELSSKNKYGNSADDAETTEGFSAVLIMRDRFLEQPPIKVGFDSSGEDGKPFKPTEIPRYFI